MTNSIEIQGERDALACLGLLANAYERFDVPVDYPGEPVPSHVFGLNIHALIIDNVDGEVLALERNTIHSDGSPLSHGEQRALRTAITRLSVKRPRNPAQAIESYYRGSMFLAKGTTPEDFYGKGATLYTTLEPCPYCASALLVSRMKRVCHVIPDEKYGGGWAMLKAAFYSSDDTTYLRLDLSAAASPFTSKVAALHARVLQRGDQLRAGGTRDTHILDFCRNELQEAFELLRSTHPSDLAAGGPGDIRNHLTLGQLQRALGMPVAGL